MARKPKTPLALPGKADTWGDVLAITHGQAVVAADRAAANFALAAAELRAMPVAAVPDIVSAGAAGHRHAEELRAHLFVLFEAVKHSAHEPVPADPEPKHHAAGATVQ